MAHLTLVTFPPSLDGEFSRFLLTHYGVRYREQRHTLLFSSVVTLVRAGTPRFPALFGEGLSLDSVLEMFVHFEQRCPPQRRLRPQDPAVARADWKLFHSTLATGTAVFAYYHLLPHRAVMVGPLSAGTTGLEVAAVRSGYPFFAGLLRLLLRLSHAREREARRTVEEVMSTVDERLADGRRYLYGDRFTIVDMAFAIAASPVVWPGEYGGAVPALEDAPPAVREMVERMRRRPSGAYALRLYRERRNAGLDVSQ